MSRFGKIINHIKSNPRILLAYVNSTGLLNNLPDTTIIKLLWWVRTGTKLDTDNPKTFNEKIQWLKLNNRDERMTMMVDKYLVRDYIANLIGEQYLIPLIDVWDDPKQIDFSFLPNQFVLKCNHNAAVGLCICRDKSKINKKKIINELQKGLKHNFYYSSREWAYKDVPRKVICEKYMEDDNGKSLRDYKFFCFNGEAKFIYISEGLENHDTAKISFYDFKGKEMPFHRSDYAQFPTPPKVPENIDEMIIIANRIAKDISIPFVRIDLYSINGRTYFSEITFYPNSGYIPFEPKDWDLKLGDWIDIQTK